MEKNKAFTFFIDSYNPIKKEYTLFNPYTKEIKILSKEDYEQLYKEQYKEKK